MGWSTMPESFDKSTNRKIILPVRICPPAKELHDLENNSFGGQIACNMHGLVLYFDVIY